MLRARRTFITSPGLAPRGQWVEQSLQWMHSQLSRPATSLSFIPNWACTISLRGNGEPAGVMGHTTVQVEH